jgi:uncharacterized protein (AIM24 family)
MIITLPCLFTKQKTKKKKSWTDGLLKVHRESGMCKLFEKPGGKKIMTALLDSTTLTREELAVALKGEEIEIDFESFLAMVDAVEVKEPSGSSSIMQSQKMTSTNTMKSKSGLIVAPFKPPSRIAQDMGNGVEATNTQQNSTIAKFSSKIEKSSNFAKRYEGTATVVVSRGAQHPTLGGGSVKAMVPGGGKYSVEDEELDELWEEEEAEEIAQGERTDEGYRKDGFVIDGEGENEWGPEEKRRRTTEAPPPPSLPRVEAENVLNSNHASASVPAYQQPCPSVETPQGQREDDWWGAPAFQGKVAAAPAGATVAASGEEDLWSF